jgi:large subunit ribosomal protein L13e
VKEGRGFSLAELKEANLTIFNARMYGLPVDVRRKSLHTENVEILKEWVTSAKENNLHFFPVKQWSKGQRGRAMRALTMSGKKLRGHVRSGNRNYTRS